MLLNTSRLAIRHSPTAKMANRFRALSMSKALARTVVPTRQ